MAELRKDPIIGRWVIITGDDRKPLGFPKKELKGGFCPFCYGNEKSTPPEIMAYRESTSKPNTPGWQLRVVPNKFPALKIEGEIDRQGIGIYDMMNGVGAHEVIIDSPAHNLTLAELEVNQIEKNLWAYKERMLDLKGDPRFKYCLIFKNQGEIAGASLEHPHSQLVATPIVPKRVKEELEGSLRYYNYKERCIYCDIICQELRDKDRLVMESDSFITFAPYASRFPYEVCLMPKGHRASFTSTSAKEMKDLAKILKETLLKIKIKLNNPAYNYMLHTVPFSLSQDLKDYHWHIEIVPSLVRIAGFEWGSGFYINPVFPEEAAKDLREVG